MHDNGSVNAGVIEGFFGRAWSWEARLSCVPFLRESGYGFYIYAPKSDAFLRRRWTEPLPPETLQRLADLAGHCRALGIELGVGLTPFEIHLDYSDSARAQLRAKVRQLNQTGAGILCILFDDMRGDVPELAALQARVIADACQESTAKRFIVAPTYYSSDPSLARIFGPAPPSYLRDLGRAVDARVDFFWTGEKVISDTYPADHLARVAGELGRKPLLWDNHMANDARTRVSHLFLDPATSSWIIPPGAVSGVAFNPMNQPYLSRIALAGYQHLLAGGAHGPRVLREVCTRLCGESFAAQLSADAGLLQRGLDAMDAHTRHILLERYASQPANPYAQDIAAWLRGEYAFDPACLTS